MVNVTDKQVKHTAGPWKLDKVWGLVLGAAGEEVCAIHAGTEVYTRRQSDQKIRQNNAFLITAAPDLLTALKIAMTYIPSKDPIDRHHLELCEAAIAKAEGGRS